MKRFSEVEGFLRNVNFVNAILLCDTKMISITCSESQPDVYALAKKNENFSENLKESC